MQTMDIYLKVVTSIPGIDSHDANAVMLPDFCISVFPSNLFSLPLVVILWMAMRSLSVYNKIIKIRFLPCSSIKPLVP